MSGLVQVLAVAAAVSAGRDDAPRVAATPTEVESALAQVVTVRRGDGMVVARGSAFFVDADGHLLTCAHVLAHMPKEEAPRLRLRDGREWPFEVVRVDEELDLALLLSRPPRRFLALAEASLPQVGDVALLAGFAARVGEPSAGPRLQHAVVVALERRWASGARRTIGSRRRVVTIKIDAVADPGQSGGPLLAVGSLRVVGVLRANLERATGGLGGVPAAGYGAAVPVMYVGPFIADLE